MKIGFLIIGSEVLDGKISDLNTKILADFLRLHHLEISHALIVRDEKQSIEDGLKALFSKADLILTSGGLGPTKDDITKETIGNFLGRKILFSDLALAVASKNYERLKRSYPGKEHGYSYLPEGFTALPNSTGFAPALFTTHENKFLFSGPGVPREFKSMLTDHVSGFISRHLDSSLFLDRIIIRTRKVPEEKIFQEVDPSLWDKLEAFGEVSSLPNLMGVDIGVKVQGKRLDEVSKKISTIKNIIEESPVKAHVWHYGPETLEEKIVTLANQKKIKFGFAESATGGLCSHRITNISGSSQSFMGSVICYDEKIKEQILGVNPQTIKDHGVVSLKCAEEMAFGLKQKLNLDIAISITGFAGPGGGNEHFPVGSVCIGSAENQNGIKSFAFEFRGEREVLKERFSQAALHTLLDALEKFSP